MEKIDYDYTNAPIFKKYGRFLPFVIYEVPEDLSDTEIDKCNDKTFIEIEPYIKGGYKQSFYMYGG